MNFKGLILPVLLGLILGACADPNSSPFSTSNSIIDRANMCATCGAAIQDNYFADSAFRAMGPGSY
ncbi:MAG: hypothetical protein ACOZFS_12120 [Thermodesulfobacteriota bacterium]